MAAIQYMHRTCPVPKENAPCAACPGGLGVLYALRHLDEHPRDAAGARRLLHDRVCVSGCGPGSDHAKRTQSRPVAALRRFRAQEAATGTESP